MENEKSLFFKQCIYFYSLNNFKHVLIPLKTEHISQVTIHF